MTTTNTPTSGAADLPEALEDFELRKMAAIGPVHESNGLVERRPIVYRRELEDQFVRGFRAAESRRVAALAAGQATAAQPAPATPQVPEARCQACIYRHDGVYGSWAPDCPVHNYDGTLRTTHVQKPAEIERVAGDVSKNGAESNMTQQPAPATQQEAQEPCTTCAALARTVMLDQVSFDRKPDCYGIRQITDDEGVEEWEDIRTSPDVAREEANDMMATGRGELYEVVPLWTTPQPTPTAQAAESEPAPSESQQPAPSPAPAETDMRAAVAVAVTMLYESHPDDVLRTFTIAELAEIVRITEAMGSEQVEAIYKRAWDALAVRITFHPAPADSVQEDAARLKEAVGLLEELAEHDSYSTEYDGRMISLCPECGEQEWEHRPNCAFVRAKTFLAARKQGEKQ